MTAFQRPRFRTRALPLLLATTLLAGCAADCQDACENVAEICAADFVAEGISFDVARCEESCRTREADCAALDEEVACVASASACADLSGCERCS